MKIVNGYAKMRKGETLFDMVKPEIAAHMAALPVKTERNNTNYEHDYRKRLNVPHAENVFTQFDNGRTWLDETDPTPEVRGLFTARGFMAQARQFIRASDLKVCDFLHISIGEGGFSVHAIWEK